MKRHYPNNSRHHIKLRDFAKKYGRNEKFRDLCWLTNAGLNLPAFIEVCQNLAEILTLLQDKANIDLSHPSIGIAEWPALLSWISQQSTKISSMLAPKSAKKVISKADGTKRLAGVTYHGCYSLLYHSHPNDNYREKYFFLAGHVLLAHIKLMREHFSRIDYEKYSATKERQDIIHKIADIYSVERTLRRLTTPEYEAILDKINPEVAPEEFVAKYIHPEIKGRSVLPKEFDSIVNFIGIANKLWNKQKRSRSKGYRRKASVWTFPGEPESAVRDEVQSDIGDPEDPNDDWGKQTAIWERAGEGKPVRKPLSLDICPEELAGEGEAYWSEYDCETTRKGPGMLVAAAKGQVRQVAMANQLFPWIYSFLANSEITSLLTVSSDLFRSLQEKKTWDEEDTSLAEIICLIHVVLWTGSSISRARQLRIFDSIEDNGTDCDVAIIPQIKPSPGGSLPKGRSIAEWRIKALTPRYKQTITAPAEATRRREEYLLLPDVVKCSRFVCYFAERMAIGKNKTIFNRQEKSYRTELNQFFNSHWSNERFTVGKLSQHLFHSIVKHTNDLTAAIAICGNPHRLGQARLFYSTIEVNALRNTYATVTRGIADNVYKASDRRSISLACKDYKTYPDRYVGSRLCATFGAVHYAFTAIRDELRSLVISDIDEFKRYHNLFTLYTIMGISYGTAFRAVTSPFLPSSDIDSESGLTVIADKDGSENHKSRLVWVPPDVIKQIGNYEAHCLSPKFFIESMLIKNKRSKELPPCFLLNDRCSYVAVSPKSITPLLQKYLPLPPNSHRRFMRMQLLERGCPPEVIDSFMGHWSRGEEPWGKYSSFSYFDYVEQLKKYLVPLLKDLNFCPTRSSLAHVA